MIKITYNVFPRNDLSADEIRRRWMDDHGELVRRHAATLRIVRYVQTLHTPDPVERMTAGKRGVEGDGPFGMAELYWASIEDMRASFEGREARRSWRVLLEDEKRFARWGEASPWVGVEREVIAPGVGATT